MAKKNKFTAEEAESAHDILEALKRGDDTHSRVGKESDFLPAYMALLASAEAAYIPELTVGMCLRTREEFERFLHTGFPWPTMVQIARHLGNCPDCYRTFLDIEGKTFKLPND